METTRGPLGFSIPIQSQKQSTNITLTPEAILTWRNQLPMADIGKTANQVFHVLNDCNQVNLTPKQRFQILELLRTPVQFICQSLRKHYINQTQPLTETQLTIAQLAETLQMEMALSYKLFLEQSSKELSSEFIEILIPTAILRLFHYYDYILLRHYQLYTIPKEELWREIHLLFEYAQNKNYLTNSNILNAYKRILLLSLTDPYKWRQDEQDTLHDACATWVNEVEIRKLHSEPVVPTIEVAQRPLSAPEKMRFLELTKLISRIKNIIKTLEPNELLTKIAHSGEPEYLIPISVLQTIIQGWEKKPARELRTERSIEVEICAGLSACHYYLNEEKAFIQQRNGADTEMASPIALAETIDLSITPMKNQSPNAKPYPLYACAMVNESESGGAGLIWQENPHPPLQPGEIIGIRSKSEDGKEQFSIAMVRWMKHVSENELRLGTQQLAQTAKAAALQIIKEGQNSGYFLRCLIFDHSIVTPILPFKTKSLALLAEDLNGKPIKIELTTLVHSTSSYKIFEYSTFDKVAALKIPEKRTHAIPFIRINKKEMPMKKSGDQGFDSIWSKL